MEFVIEDTLYRIDDSFVHPGGNEILKAHSGQDITSLFNGTDASGHKHGAAAKDLLRKWEVVQGVRSDGPIDLEQPIMDQLPLVKDTYMDWINRPTAVQPIFFRNKSAEQLTKVKWWLVPLLWIPIACTCLVTSCGSIIMSRAALLSCMGILLWQGIEYGLHRFVFHWEPHCMPAVYMHFLFHGCHHKFPTDVDRLVFPPFPASIIAGLIFSVIRIFYNYAESLSVFSGVLFGYIAYDCSHYFIHSGWYKNRASRSHMHHHYVDHTKNFGITSPLLDIVFNTMYSKASSD